MPNRIIRDSARTSQTLDLLSAEGERLFWRLTTVADDFGRFEADPRILLAHCFPLKAGEWRPTTVEQWRDGLVMVGAIKLYSANGRLYGYFTTWGKYQQMRAKVSKFPDPLTGDGICKQTLADASTCEQIPSESESESIEEPLSGNSARLDTSKPGDTEARQASEAHEAEAPAAPARAGHLKVVPDNTVAREILDHLNRRTGHAYEPVEANLKLIRARLAEPGRTRQQVLAVIDAKVAQWLKDPEMSVYLRPETLFGAKKFAQYVGALAQGKAEPPPETPEEAYVRKQLSLMGEVVTLAQAKVRLAKMARVEGTHAG